MAPPHLHGAPQLLSGPLRVRAILHEARTPLVARRRAIHPGAAGFVLRCVQERLPLSLGGSVRSNHFCSARVGSACLLRK
jgi:hypothetical protein